ncbi:MAG TPA: riboflavin synthase [Gammaproteobacteria bacterium]|nr:riboflavin synthase [Gammaproteobacteria bacterium]
MFTGIVQACGRIIAREMRGGDSRYRIHCGGLDLAGLRPGDSLAVNGVCLTAVEAEAGEVTVDVSIETLRCTTLGAMEPGQRVNLEPALLPTMPLGGHFVSGHVDGVGKVAAITPAGRSMVLDIELPPALTRYVAPKGSICVDGVSLTVNSVREQGFSVNIIPHTLEHTVIGDYDAGREVNIEVDLLARYLERLLACREETAAPALDREFLRTHGYLAHE